MIARLTCRLGFHHWVQQRVEEATLGECTRCLKRDFDRYGDGMPICGPWQNAAGQTTVY